MKSRDSFGRTLKKRCWIGDFQGIYTRIISAIIAADSQTVMIKIIIKFGNRIDRRAGLVESPVLCQP